jgi:PAS domain S-box-containing protein
MENPNIPEVDNSLDVNCLTAIIESTPIVIYAKAADGRLLIANDATRQLIGKSWLEVEGKTDREFLSDPAQADMVMENDRHVMATGQTIQVEEWVGASPRLFLSTKSPMRDENGVVVGLAGVSVDITDLKAAEAMAIESEARCRALNEALELEVAKGRADRERLDLALNASGMIGVWDGDLRQGLVFGDENFARIYGVDPVETAAGRPLGYYFEKMPEEDRQAAVIERDRMLAGSGEFTHEHRIIRPDGSLLWVLARGRLLRDADGTPHRFVGASVDITQRKLAEIRQAFLVELQDLMRGLEQPQAILEAAGAHLGRFLNAGRIGFGEVQADDETVIVTCLYANGLPPVNAVFKLADFGAHIRDMVRQGRTIVYDDMLTDPQRSSDIWDQIGTRAHVTVPLIRDGRYTGSLYVTHAKPHRWQPADVSLIEDVAARIWEATERGRAEVKLRQSEEQVRLAMESGGFGSWEYDASTGVVIRSLKHDQLYGYGDRVLDWDVQRFINHILPADRDRVQNGLRTTLETGIDWQDEYRINPACGGERWLEIRARRQTAQDGSPMRLVGTLADITERKMTQAAAIESVAQFQHFAQAMANHVWTASADGSLDWLNDRVIAYSGMAAEQLKSGGWLAIVHPEDIDAVEREWRRALDTGQQYEAQCRLRRGDGSFRWHIVRAVAILGKDHAIRRWIGTNTDIEEQKQTADALATLNATLHEQVRERTAELMAAEESLRQSQKMEAVGQLTGGIAHDFNNLLTGIAGGLEMLENRLAQGRVAELPRYLNLAQSATKRAAALTHRLLAFSRRQTLDPKPIDINRLVSDLDDLLRRTVGPAISVTVVKAAALWPTLVDPSQLDNALLNLCINARDAMQEGGAITIATDNHWIDDQAGKSLDLPPGRYVSLCVSDTGVGMPPAVIQRAFDPFFTTKPVGEGTGLGLSMIYGFVRQSGGQARIISAEGEGTSVWLYLPGFFDTIDAQDPPSGTVEQQTPADHRTVLVVDDEPTIRLLVGEILSDMRYTAIEAVGAEDGLDVLKADNSVDLLITDVGLAGGMNGRQLADAARVLRPDLKILFITGYAETVIAADGQLGPGMSILKKPFTLEGLTKRIREIV